jgi:hypothetical protein
VAAVPEPSSVTLALLAGLLWAIAIIRRQRGNRSA